MKFSWKAIFLWIANAVRLVMLLLVCIFSFKMTDNLNVLRLTEPASIADQLYMFDEVTWDGFCGEIHYTYYYMDDSQESMIEKYCSNSSGFGFALGISALAPTPMLIPAALFALGGYITENDVRNHHLPLYTKYWYHPHLQHECDFFNCNLEADIYFNNQPNIYHYSYPQSHLWWYWTSAVFSLISAICRPLGKPSPWARK